MKSFQLHNKQLREKAKQEAQEALELRLFLLMGKEFNRLIYKLRAQKISCTVIQTDKELIIELGQLYPNELLDKVLNNVIAKVKLKVDFTICSIRLDKRIVVKNFEKVLGGARKL